MQSQNDRMICFQGKSFNITVIQVYAPTTNAKVAEVEQFYENLQDVLDITHTHTHKSLFHHGEWNAKVGSQGILGVTGSLALEYKMKQDKG